MREREGSSCIAWFANSFPSATSDFRTSISSSPPTCDPITKNVAVASFAFKICKISVVYWEGQSSIVRAMVFEVDEMRQRTVGKRC